MYVFVNQKYFYNHNNNNAMTEAFFSVNIFSYILTVTNQIIIK